MKSILVNPTLRSLDHPSHAVIWVYTKIPRAAFSCMPKKQWGFKGSGGLWPHTLDLSPDHEHHVGHR